MEQTLLLNASYEPLKIVHWQKAITLCARARSRSSLCTTARSAAVSISFKLPSVIRLLRYIKIKRRFDYVPFSRATSTRATTTAASTAATIFPQVS